MRDKIAKVAGLLDVTTDLYVTNPQVMIDVDREKAAVYGITIDQVRQELFDAFGTRQVATIYTPSNDYQVILETKPEFRHDPSNLSEHLRQDQRRRRRASAGRRHARRRPGRRRHRQRHPVRAVDPAVGGDHAGARRSGRCSSTTRASSRR